MLIQLEVEHRFDARLPKRFAAMDIRDLIKPEYDSSLKVETLSPQLNRVPTTATNPPFRSSVSLPSLSTTHPVLPSPADLTKLSHGSSVAPPNQAAYGSQQEQHPASTHHQPQNAIYQQVPSHQQPNCWPHGFVSNKRRSPPDDSRPAPPPKRQSKWNPEEDRKIIAYRGQGMKWSEISARLYPRTEIGCRLHYQNYLEKRSDWDEEKKNKLARVYERVKEDMWKLVANEMKIPWRSAEGMHWIMGETEMARRANVTPFSNTIQSCSAPTSTTTAVYNTSTNFGNGHHRGSIYRDNGNTIIFEPEQLSALKAPPGTNATNGPVSTFATAGSGLSREPAIGENASTVPTRMYTDHPNHEHGKQFYSTEVGKECAPLSPCSDRAMRDISPRTYQAMREKKARLPSVSEMECMVPLTSSALPSDTGSGLRKESEDRSVSARSHNSAFGRVEDSNG